MLQNNFNLTKINLFRIQSMTGGNIFTIKKKKMFFSFFSEGTVLPWSPPVIYILLVFIIKRQYE